MKPNKQNIINDILIELEKGKSYKEVSLVILRKFKFTEPTFVKYWKIANETHAERQELIKRELERDSVDSAKERLKKAILTREEGLAMLSITAKLIYAKINNEKESPSVYEANSLNNIVSNMAKLEGWNAPVKQAQTDSKGNDVKPIDLSKYMTFEQIMEALDDAKNIHE